MIKVLGLALYGPLAASTRYRLGQYVPGLASMGIDLQIHHLLGDEYLRRRFNGGRLVIPSVIQSAFERLADLFFLNNYDLVILHCELFPLMPGWMERALIRKPYLYDFDDAFYLKYCSEPMRLVKPLLSGKFDTVISGATAVTAGNQTLATYAKKHKDNTYYFPTVVDCSRYIPNTKNRGCEVFTIGWIGSPSTSPYLNELIEPLSSIGKEGSVRFIVIGGKAPKIPNISVIEINWDEQTEIDLLNTFDVGVMPLPDNNWARGKCAFKLIQYMACAVPVIASPVGANVEVVNLECGLFAATSHEWEDAFRLYRDKPDMRAKMGEAGRVRVLEQYSLSTNLPFLAEVITNSVNVFK